MWRTIEKDFTTTFGATFGTRRTAATEGFSSGFFEMCFLTWRFLNKCFSAKFCDPQISSHSDVSQAIFRIEFFRLGFFWTCPFRDPQKHSRSDFLKKQGKHSKFLEKIEKKVKTTRSKT